MEHPGGRSAACSGNIDSMRNSRTVRSVTTYLIICLLRAQALVLTPLLALHQSVQTIQRTKLIIAACNFTPMC